jgi:hypothetical protein
LLIRAGKGVSLDRLLSNRNPGDPDEAEDQADFRKAVPFHTALGQGGYP